jgi:hypothetical protein
VTAPWRFSQAKETLQETKDAVASLVTKLHKAT